MAGRPEIVGPDAGPEAPFPYKMEGKVISGFGRGSKELGIPTANLPVDDAATSWISAVPSGVYLGYAALALPADHPDRPAGDAPFHIFPMVMSIGYNPFYKNTVRSAEVHVLHKFAQDFYGAHMRLLILGFIREEKDYKSLEALVEDINFDCHVARTSLARDAWAPARDAVVGGEVDGKLDAQWLLAPL
jgi:riboflavin kinase